MNSSDLTCICCGSHHFQHYFKGLLRCTSCRHAVANLDLEAINSKDIYSMDYFEQGEYLDYVKDRSCFEKNFQKRLTSLRKIRPGGKLLEIGSAGGFFLNLAQAHFQTVGYEICEEMADYGRGHFNLNIKSTDFIQDDFSDASFDVVVMWDVIEHLTHPDQFLHKIKTILNKEGIVALTTGDMGSLMAQIQGPSWRLIHPPTHVHYFTKESMKMFLNRQGFEVISIEYPGYYRSVSQMLHGIFGTNKGLWDRIEKSSWSGWPVYLNLFDIMQVIARKSK